MEGWVPCLIPFPSQSALPSSVEIHFHGNNLTVTQFGHHRMWVFGALLSRLPRRLCPASRGPRKKSTCEGLLLRGFFVIL